MRNYHFNGRRASAAEQALFERLAPVPYHGLLLYPTIAGDLWLAKARTGETLTKAATLDAVKADVDRLLGAGA